MRTIKAAVTHGAGRGFSLEPVTLDEPHEGEILVKVAASGICHTDVEGAAGHLPTKLPAVLGHEGAGIVEKVGPYVTEFKPGDRVSFSYGFCNRCVNCYAGKTANCLISNEINFGGVMPDGTSRLSQDGETLSMFFAQSSFAEYAVVAAHTAVKIEHDDIDLAVVAPFGCGIQTGAGTVLNALKPEFGSSIAVFGCGTVGMSAIMAARIAGCSNIIAVGGKDATLALARELGATHAINRKTCRDIAAEIVEITGGGANYAVETSGNENFVRTALHCLAPLGVEAVVGIAPKMEIDLFGELMYEAKTIRGVIQGASVPRVFIPQLIEYYRQGRFPVDRIMRFYAFDDIDAAFADSASGKCIKAVVRM